MNNIRLAGFLDNSNTNGEGLRSVIFISGCDINCKGCQNKEMQNENYGDLVNFDDIVERIKSNIDIIDGITISGGDPIYNKKTYDMIKYIKSKLPKINIWLYTGRTYEWILKEYNNCNFYPYNIFQECDVVVDGPYIEELNNGTVLYRGSTNQRIIDVKETLYRYKLTEYKLEEEI